MSFTIKNLTSNNVSADYVYLTPGESRDYLYVTTEVLSAYSAGLISISPDPAAAAPASIVALTNNGGGTSGGNTIAAISNVDASGVNAIATLAEKLNAVITAVNALSGASGDSNTNALANDALVNSRLV